MRNRATTPLSKAKVRMSMSKYNLYNLSRIMQPSYRMLNFYKQKWKSKSLLRDYHGEQVREKQWQKMFSRKLRSVVPMDPAYLARNDGTNESAGRGSGLMDGGEQSPQREHTPYMNMTFAPLERRLDVAIFRALFASSARQARQFVVHGAVKVNGKTMRYPGYLLNPGDLFQVEPERVMFAMGQPKEAAEADGEEADAQGREGKGEGEGSETIEAVGGEPGAAAGSEGSSDPSSEVQINTKETLKSLLDQSKAILGSSKEGMSAKRKQDLREFGKSVRSLLSRANRQNVFTDSLEAQFQEIQHQLRIQRENKEQGTSALPSEQSGDQRTEAGATGGPSDAAESTSTSASGEDMRSLRSALSTLRINPIDDDKPYATPWAPRDYMSAFAFIPRYLEVNHNICAAVYVRHPVARPRLAEVPTFMPETIQANAFGWYLRRR